MRNVAELEDIVPGGIGHNQAPIVLPDPDILAAQLEYDHDSIVAEVSRLSSRELPEKIDDEKTAGTISDYLKAIVGCEKDIDKAHKAAKEPYLNLGRVVDSFKNKHAETLKGMKTRALNLQTDWLTRKAAEERKALLERQRIEREKAEALAREAQAHQAEGIEDTAKELMDHAVATEQKADAILSYAMDAKDSKLAKARGAGGGVTGLVTSWVGEPENPSYAGINLNFLFGSFKEEHIQEAINRFVKNGGRDLPGVKIYEKSEAKFRR